MKIQLQDGRMLEGTALQIVQAMRALAFGASQFSIPQYIQWVINNTEKFEGFHLDVQGKDDDELAAGLVNEMLRAGLARTA